MVTMGPSYLGGLLDLLWLIGDEPGLTLNELSRRTGVPASTVFRLTGLCVEHGWVIRDQTSGEFRPGLRLLRLGLTALQHLGDIASFDEPVAALAAATGESVSVGMLYGDQIVLVARRESSHPLRMVVRAGDVIPPHRTAMGKAILAHLPPERRRAVLAQTGDAAGILTQLEPELEEVVSGGFARDEEVFEVGLRSIAAPFFGSGHEILGAISIAGPAARFTPDRALAAVRPLLDQVAAVSRRLGGDRREHPQGTLRLRVANPQANRA